MFSKDPSGAKARSAATDDVDQWLVMPPMAGPSTRPRPHDAVTTLIAAHAKPACMRALKKPKARCMCMGTLTTQAEARTSRAVCAVRCHFRGASLGRRRDAVAEAAKESNDNGPPVGEGKAEGNGCDRDCETADHKHGSAPMAIAPWTPQRATQHAAHHEGRRNEASSVALVAQRCQPAVRGTSTLATTQLTTAVSGKPVMS